MKSCLVLLLLFSLSSWAQYERGSRVCTDKSEEYYKQDSEDIGNQYLYAACLVIKGEDAKGLAMLYHLSDHQSSVTASFFLADYLETDGRFMAPSSEKNLDEAIGYYLRTQAIIALIPSYPEPDYFFHEKNHQMELKAVYRVPFLYLRKYGTGIIGDYRRHLLQSPNYTGSREKETYSQYNSYMLDSLSKVARYAGECANLPQKRYFNSTRYQATIEACHLLEELAFTLIPLEEKRQEILLQPHCKDLNETNCPEYYETHKTIYDLREDFIEKLEIVFQPVVNASN
ncbi:MAG: hypothetical protein OXN83_05240 [Oligoflexia bacterium]|nr:hypothetical protein [Oligoflexia bacterium]